MKYLILGAGPAGLTFANKLKQTGETSFLVIEQEKEAGGLCRSVTVDNAPFDIGGGHFLDVRREKVNEFLFQFMPEEEWNKYDRNSKISMSGMMINSPIEANIWQFPLEEQVAYLKSIAVAGCNIGKEKPEAFIDWITWKLGDKIAKDYMIPYNQKMFAQQLDELGTYWLDKLPNVSFEETLLSCLQHQAYGTQPGHAQFFYPKKYGYGELWRRMADNIADNIIYKTKVIKLDLELGKVCDEAGEEYKADNIITTIPWASLKEITGLPEALSYGIKNLKSSSIETRYFSENLDTDAQWIYYPDKELPYHRILVRHNFCPNSKGYWTETRKERVGMFQEKAKYSYINEYAYPLNTIGKNEYMSELLAWCQTKKLYGLGRWGEHQHFNSDVTVERAMQLAERLLKA